MANVANPSKVFNFRVEIDGIDQFEVQEINIPDAEIAVTEHGDGNSTVGTGGQIKFGNITLKKLRALPLSDKWAWNWLMQVQDPISGGGQLPDQYKKVVIIKELAPDNKTTVTTWTCLGAFPIKSAITPLSRTSSDNTMQDCTLWVDKVICT
jgi:phage tail-like protein